MPSKFYAGMMLLSLVISMGTLFFAMQPSVQAGGGDGQIQNAPPPDPGCVPGTSLWIGSCQGVCPLHYRQIHLIETRADCSTWQTTYCAYDNAC